MCKDYRRLIALREYRTMLTNTGRVDPKWFNPRARNGFPAGILLVAALALAGCRSGDTPIDVVHEFTTTTLAGEPMPGEGPENPMPVGEAMSVGGWNVVVAGRNVDTDIYSGGQTTTSVAVSVRATYDRRPGEGRFFEDLRIGAIGSRGATYEFVQADCPNALEHTGTARPGDTVEGNLCFEFAGEIDDLHLVLTALGGPTAHQVYLATR